jgi:hypothetical protein
MWHISGVQARLHSLLLEAQRRGDSERVRWGGDARYFTSS